MATYPYISTFLTEDLPTWANPDLNPRAAQYQTKLDQIISDVNWDENPPSNYYIKVVERTYYGAMRVLLFYLQNESTMNLDFTDLEVTDPPEHYANQYALRVTYPDDFSPPAPWKCIYIAPRGVPNTEPELMTQEPIRDWLTRSYDFVKWYANYEDFVTDVYIEEATIPFTVNGESLGIDYLAFTKDYYTLNVVVAATEQSKFAVTRVTPEGETDPFNLYTYTTWPYQINIDWYSPVDGYHFIIPLTEIDRYEQAATMSKDFNSESEQWDYTLRASIGHSNGPIAQGIRGMQQAIQLSVEQIGTKEIRPEYTDLTDCRVFYSFKLAWLVQKAQQIKAGVTEQDLFTEIHAKFFYDGEMPLELAADIVCDFSSLFDSDVDINQEGKILPGENVNDLPALKDDNIYTDRVDLITPTLTSTGVFNRCYVLTAAEINDLCDYLYNADDNIFEELMDGVLARGNPVEALIDLRLWPFDVSEVTGEHTYENIKFGRTQTTIRGIKLPQNANAVIDLGSAVVPRYWSNFLDYHMSVQLYIPFCGVVELPIDKVLNHKVSVKLICDYVTGAGTAVVFADDIPILYQQGVIGVSVPMTASNSSEWAKTVMGNVITSGADLAGSLATGNASGAMKSAEGGLSTASALYNGSHIQQVGASSPQVSLFQPKNCYMVLGIVQPASFNAKAEVTEEDTYVWGDTYAKNVGYATFMPISRIGNIQETGFYAFDNVKTDIPSATKEEAEQIISLLKNGIFIKRET